MSNQPLIKKRSVYSLNSLLRKYPLEVEQSQENLNKCLTIVDIISYGVGSTVGAGVFVSIGIAISQKAGPGTLLSFLFSALACLISAFCYSEFSTRIPVSGSAYTFAYVSLGEFAGWFVGWNLTLEYAISASAVARGWAGYFQEIFVIFGHEAPEWITGISINSFINISPLAPIIIIICTIILVFGIKDSSRFNVIITMINIITILFFIITGSIYIDVKNWTPFLPFGMKGVFQGCSIIFFSYVGFDSVTTLAGEVKNPKRDLPIGIVGTLVIATTLYIGVTLVLSGMVNYVNVNVNSPLSSPFENRGMKWAAIILAIGTLTSLTASTLCCLLGQPRIYLQMAKDGLFFKKFASVNEKTQTPVFGTIFTGVFASILAIILDLDQLTNMISVGTLMAFTVVCAGVVIMRFRDENGVEHSKIPSAILLFVLYIFASLFGVSSANDWNIGIQIAFCVPMLAIMIGLCFKKQINIPTTFKCPFNPVVPCLGIIVNSYFIMHLTLDSLYRVLIWTVAGAIIYFAYGIRNSKLNESTQTPQSDSDIGYSNKGINYY
ncbi:hypothetical protein CYY_003558 [Polysphondylium violaceum]|uniref:Cationic amino acid transporter C-terminal domain-containing protein n=1 Tax=Polysphondylium violaceum TaxID=133409 RepID=A0A8J4PUI8_9MYCE|nr:hypothetical protein CYY_003558 [Polysphondylium violaceum]